jgi:Flp pilus assembly protein protease CpaA
MGFVDVFRFLLLTGLLGWASYTEVKEKRVPNELSFSAMAVGLLLGLAGGGLDGLKLAFWGLTAGGGPLLLVYLFGLSLRKRLLGGGDVKLMAAIGAFVGPVGALWSLYYGIWIAGLTALLLVIYCYCRRRDLPKTMALGACLCIGTLLWVLQHGPQLLSGPPIR